MCRHLAYLGPPASLRSLLIDPPHSLYRQAWAPRLQRHGTVNADGFGVGWYADGDPVPGQVPARRAHLGGPVAAGHRPGDRSAAVLAAVRSATPGTAVGEAAAAPFGARPLAVQPQREPRRLARLSAAAIAERDAQAGVADEPPVNRPAAATVRRRCPASLEAMVDSAFLWALVLERLRAGSADGRRAGRRRSRPSRRRAGRGGSTSCSPTGVDRRHRLR